MHTIKLGREICTDFGGASRREWLLTNGLGGFASGTACDVHTRRYHGLLVAALNPPSQRVLMLSKLDTVATYDGRVYPLSTNEFADGTITPHGLVHIQSFALEYGLPVWRFAVADAVLERRILMIHGQNTTCVRWKIIRASASVELHFRVFCTHRDFHSHTQGGYEPALDLLPDGVRVTAFEGATPYSITCPDANYAKESTWYWGFRHRVEDERGLDATEDLHSPGFFQTSLLPNDEITLTASVAALSTVSFGQALATHEARIAALQGVVPATEPAWVHGLALAADQFMVERWRDGTRVGMSMLAGYPWFGEWGRDTMIALPGLAMVLRRHALAAQVLRTFADHVQDGLIPNRFPDVDGPPQYNTADATLWFIHAVGEHARRSDEWDLASELYPTLKAIVSAHIKGTRYAIAMDPSDALLQAGENGVQVTWMDARVGDHVVTPRIGKPVEINALWLNAVSTCSAIAEALGLTADHHRYSALAERIRDGFQRFWCEEKRYLYDVIDCATGKNDGYDDALRPNQLLAVSLPIDALDDDQARSIVTVCARHLLTAYGLRSLAPSATNYEPRFAGPIEHRDNAYHQGTVWTWLLGPFADAHYKVYGDATLARSFLQPIGEHLYDGCVGNVSEVFEPEAPHMPAGCFAQAWSVAEVLRAWLDIVPTPHATDAHAEY